MSPGPGSGPPWLAPALLTGAAIFLYMVRGILTPFVLAAVLAYLLSPVVTWAHTRRKVPRPLAIATLFLVGLGPLTALFWVLEPALVRETRALIENAPEILVNSLSQLFGGEAAQLLGVTIRADALTQSLLDAFQGALGTPAEALHVAAWVVELLFDTFLTLVLTFYFLLNPRPFGSAILRFVRPENRPSWIETGREIHRVLGRYVRGLLFLVVLMATVTYLGLALIFRLPHALPLAIATGFLEIIPFLGPVVAGTVAALVALFYGGGTMALGVALMYLILRQLEDQLVMPNVIGRAVELHPAASIFAVLAGGALAGITGALLAIPVAAATKVVLDRWRPA